MIVIDPITIEGEGATRAGTATYINSAGKVAVAAANELRFSYDPLDLDAPPVVLVERAPAVNLLSYPRNFNNAVWAKFASTVRGNVAVSPDGSMGADKLIEDVGNSGHQAYQSATVVAGSKYAFSAVMKAAERSKATLQFNSNNGAFTASSADFDLAAGTVQNISCDSATIEPLGGGWYFCTVVESALASVLGFVSIFINNGAGATYPGDGTSGLYIWHAQLEVGSKASSIIPDATAFVSRGGPKWEFNSAGALAQSAADVAVIAYDPVTLLSRGMSLEAATLNAIRNNTMVGAFSGTPGTMPTNWFKTDGSGIVSSVVGVGNENGIDYIDIRWAGTASASLAMNVGFEASTVQSASAGQVWTASAFMKLVAGSMANITSHGLIVDEYTAAGAYLTGSGGSAGNIPGSASNLRVFRDQFTRTLTHAFTARVTCYHNLYALAGAVVDITLRIGLPQLEQVSAALPGPTSPIKTTGTSVIRAADISTSPPATRAADVLGTGTLQYSNVQETEYPTYSATGVYGPGERVIYAHEVHQQVLGSSAAVTLSIASPCVVTQPAHTFANGQPVKLMTNGALPTGLTAGATYFVVNQAAGTYQLSVTVGGAAINTSGTQSGVHTLTANAIGQTPGPGSLYWTRVSVSNQRMMFDTVNNTQTENLNAITVTLTPGQIAGGLYLGGVVGESVDVSVVGGSDGVVYSKSTSLDLPNSGSSFWGWGFNKIRKKNFFLALDLPPYWEAVVTVTINKPGSIAKCGMLALGPATEIGFSLYGLGLEDKDYSSTRFDVDGASETVKRGYSKILTLDVVIYNDLIDTAVDQMLDFRQRNVVWVGAVDFGHTVVYGKRSSFKSVIPDLETSRMALKIDGVI